MGTLIEYEHLVQLRRYQTNRIAASTYSRFVSVYILSAGGTRSKTDKIQAAEWNPAASAKNLPGHFLSHRLVFAL